MAVEVDDTGYLYAAFPTFYYNPLHDLESVAWTALHAVLSRRSATGSGHDTQRAQLQVAVGSRYFHSIGHAAQANIPKDSRRFIRNQQRPDLSVLDDLFEPYGKVVAHIFDAISRHLRMIKSPLEQPTDDVLESSPELQTATPGEIVRISRLCHQSLATPLARITGVEKFQTIFLNDLLACRE